MKTRKIEVRKLNINEVVRTAVKFHGHLGPFLIVGIKMGHLALKGLNSKGHNELSVLVETGTKPPLSCLVDGIQISTGCTTGKGNLKVIDKKKVRATFSKEKKSIEIELRAEILRMIDEEKDSYEETAKRLIGMPEEEIFQWK